VALQARDFDKIPDRLLYSLLAWQYRSFDGELRHLNDYFPRDAAKTGTVVDVGAWWGPWTYWLSRKADHVVTIEPVPHLAAFLRRVTADNVDLIETALSDRPGMTELYVPTGGSGSEGRSTVEPRVASGERSKVEVKLTPLDDLDLRDVVFIKIDVEGHELPVLRGAKRTLAEQRPVVLIEIEQRGDVAVRDVVDHLVEQGFQGWFRYERRWHPIEHFDVQAHQLRAQATVERRGYIANSLLGTSKYVNNFLFLPAGSPPPGSGKPRARTMAGHDDAASSVAMMRRDWEERAGSNPLYYIDARQREWTHADFYAGGPELVARFVDPALAELGVDPAGRRVLEIGCGMGRLFEGLSARFGDVWGIDISETMIAKGREHCPVAATWLLGDGRSLAGVDDDSVDHVISFEVFQHIPEREIIFSYLAECRRVLRPGGTLHVQLRCGSDSKAQAIVRALPRPLRVSVARALRAVRILPVVGDIDTWLGSIVAPNAAVEELTRLGFEGVAVLPDDVHVPGLGYSVVGRVPA
jgi:FkbM family methyltransferase